MRADVIGNIDISDKGVCRVDSGMWCGDGGGAAAASGGGAARAVVCVSPACVPSHCSTPPRPVI